jgi:hypothetical protein
MDQETDAPDTPKCGKTSEPVVLHHAISWAIHKV